MLPNWFPDAIGMVSSLLLAVPAWRAANLLKIIFAIESDASEQANLPDNRSQAEQPSLRRQRSDFVPNGDVAKELAKAMRESSGRWDPLDDRMLKAGLLLLLLSFVTRLFVAVPAS